MINRRGFQGSRIVRKTLRGYSFLSLDIPGGVNRHLRGGVSAMAALPAYLRRHVTDIVLRTGTRAFPPRRHACAQRPEEAVRWVPTASIRRRLSTRIVNLYQSAHGFDFKYFSDRSRAALLPLGGFWDRWTDDALSLMDYPMFRERFLEGKAWAATEVYQYQKAKLHGEQWERWRRKTDVWDRVFEDIRANGYRTQCDVLPEARSLTMRTEGSPLNEIQVVMTRTGELLRVIGGGDHRFMIAHILGIAEIPVIINVRHSRCDGLPSPARAARMHASEG
jgi:hypothetical protein